jgi:uncharacterized membrane protein
MNEVTQLTSNPYMSLKYDGSIQANSIYLGNNIGAVASSVANSLEGITTSNANWNNRTTLNWGLSTPTVHWDYSKLTSNGSGTLVYNPVIPDNIKVFTEDLFDFDIPDFKLTNFN